jgi:hypothetical protein
MKWVAILSVILFLVGCDKSACDQYEKFSYNRVWIDETVIWSDSEIFSKNLGYKETKITNTALALKNPYFPMEKDFLELQLADAFLFPGKNEGEYDAVLIGRKNLAGIVFSKRSINDFLIEHENSVSSAVVRKINERSAFICM